jgi:hypothetical protein
MFLNISSRSRWCAKSRDKQPVATSPLNVGDHTLRLPAAVSVVQFGALQHHVDKETEQRSAAGRRDNYS